MKNYYCFLADKPDGYERDNYWFIAESGDIAQNLRLSIAGTEWTMQSWFFTNKKLFIDEDVCAIRFLPQGVSLVRRGKYLSSHESNPWPDVFRDLDNSIASDDDNHGFNVSYEQMPYLNGEISKAFERTGVWLKPGKFAKLMGSTDVEAEKFSREYDILLNGDKSEKYEFKLVSGDDIIKYYRTDSYADSNGSPLWGSCMNNKSSIIKFYAKNKKDINMAVLFLDGKVVGRSIVWVNATISEWGTSGYVCMSEKLLYKGMFADRTYYYDDDALDVMRINFKKLGICFKHSTCYGDGDLSIGVDGEYCLYPSSRLLITAKVATVGGPVPYLDTLSYASSNKQVANRLIDGKVKRCVSTNGQVERCGEYVKVTLGVAGVGDPDVKFAYKSVSSAYKVVLPDGRVLYAYGPSSNYGLNPFNDDFRSHYLIGDLSKTARVTLPSITRFGNESLRTLDIEVYPHQLDYDFATRSYRVTHLFDNKTGSYHPVDEFLIKSVGRGYHRTLQVVRCKREAHALNARLQPSIQVDITHPQIQVI